MSRSRGLGDSAELSAPLGREHPLIITIDTSAVKYPPDTTEAPAPSSSASTDNFLADTNRLLCSGGVSPVGKSSSKFMEPSASTEGPSQESRATYPRDGSRLTPKTADASSNLLSVPVGRSRGSSIGSEGSACTSSTFEGQTYVPTSLSGSHTSLSPGKKSFDCEDASRSDSGKDTNLGTLDGKFAFSRDQLNELTNPKSLDALNVLGGLFGLEKGLRTNIHSGLGVDEKHIDSTEGADKVFSETEPQQFSVSASHITEGLSKQIDDAFADRKRAFGDNTLPHKKSKSFGKLAWETYNDKVLILLTIAAVTSLALGIYQSVTTKPGQPRVQWVEGVAIIIAILIVVIVGTTNDWQKERQFVSLNEKKESRDVRVQRSGKTIEISVHEILVGDVMHLEPGDVVPVDGVFIEGHNIRCDESSATGESDILGKTPAQEVCEAAEVHGDQSKKDPFIISGTKVLEGRGTFLVTATGPNSTYGRTWMSLNDEIQKTPLQSKLNVLAEHIAKLGLAAGLLLFVALFIKFLVQLKSMHGAEEKGQAFLQIFIVAVTVIVVAVPEGLPLAVTLALAFATTRMLKDNNLVRFLQACETMGNATTICSDKTGTLTQNKMTAVTATLGTTSHFGNEASERQGSDSPSQATVTFINTLSPAAKRLLLDSIALNSTAFEGEEDGMSTFIGSKTETALLTFARDFLGMSSVSEERANANVVDMLPFESGRKCMAVVVKCENRYRMYVKGAPEVLLANSVLIVGDLIGDLTETLIPDDIRTSLSNVITSYASRSLRTIGLAYRDFEQWPPRGAHEEDVGLDAFGHVLERLVFMGVFGIRDPLRLGVKHAVHQCQQAGIFVRMVTGDNILTAKAISEECGLLSPTGIAMEGPEFRKLSPPQMTQIIPELQILARASPDDKKLLVSQLKKLGEIVAVTGDGTNDAQALKLADVGFSMGITGTEVAKEASDIILLDDNFSSLVKAISWGRTVNDAVKKFLQFQVTVNITAVLLTFVSAVASGDGKSVLTAVQLLWINLIMDTFAALALATDPPSSNILKRKPEPRSSPLISPTMWKMIIGQSVYQLAVTLILNFAGKKIFNYHTPEQLNQLQTLVFNTFVWMQIFNQFNCRRLDNGLNIIEGIYRNGWFIGIQCIIVAGQIMIVFIGGQAVSVHRLNGTQWAVSLCLGFTSFAVAVIIRLIPDEIFMKVVRSCRFSCTKRKPSHSQELLTRVRSADLSRKDAEPHAIGMV